MFARTPRLLLRPGFPEDAPALVAAMSDRAIARNLAVVPWPYTLRDAAEFVRHTREASSGVLRLAIEQAGTAIGVIGCERTADGAAAELGYWLAEPHWGKGYVSEATRAIIDWAFQQPSIYRVYATTDVENVASRRVLEKVGMQ